MSPATSLTARVGPLLYAGDFFYARVTLYLRHTQRSGYGR